MQIRWLATALQNLDQKADYIAKDVLQAAMLVLMRIRHAVNLLEDNPALGHPGRIHDTRELVAPEIQYLIPYRMSLDSSKLRSSRYVAALEKPHINVLE